MKSKKSTTKMKMNRKSNGSDADSNLMGDKSNAQTIKGSQEAATSLIAFGCGAGGILVAARQLDIVVAGVVDNDLASLQSIGTNFPTVERVIEQQNSEKHVEVCLALIANRKTHTSKIIVVAALPRIDSKSLNSREIVDERLLNIARVVVRCRAAIAIFELDSTPHGCRFAPLGPAPYKLLSDGGYKIQIVNLNTKDFGLALDRVRTFVFASRRKLDREAILDQIHSHSQNPSTIQNAIGDLPPDPPSRTDGAESPGESGGVYNHVPPQHARKLIERLSRITSVKKKGERYSRPSGDGTMAIVMGHRAPPLHFVANRALTPREMARLAGIPDSFIFEGNYGEQQYQSSSASSPPLIKAVLAAARAATVSKTGATKTPKPKKPR